MIHFPSKKELEELKAYEEPNCLSLYVPYIEPNSPENPIRIEVKNMLKDARFALDAEGAPVRDIRKTLRPIKEQMEESERWSARGEGLVFFSHTRFFKSYHIPDDSAPHLVHVGTGFHLEPLIEAMKNNKRYFVLALGHKNVQLYEGDRDGIEQLKLKDFPHDMKKTLRIDEYPQVLQTRPVAIARLGKKSEAFHEQYDVKQADKTMLKEFFRRIDKRLKPHLQEHGYPMILGGVEYELAMYRSVNTYTDVLDEAIKGNLENAKPDEIREKAWAIVNGN